MISGVTAGIFGAALGFQQLSPTSSTLLTVPAGATLAVIISAASFTWRDDATAPTTTAGMVWPANLPLYYGGDLAALKVINTSGTVNVSYYE
jgi:hypothetical protein